MRDYAIILLLLLLLRGFVTGRQQQALSTKKTKNPEVLADREYFYVGGEYVKVNLQIGKL